MNAFRALTSIGAASIALVACAASAAVTVIDFNSQNSNAVGSLTIGSVTFTPEGTAALFTSTFGNGPNGTVGLAASGSEFIPLRATIGGGTSFVSVDLGDFNADADSLFLRLYDINDILLASDTAEIDASFTGMVTLSATAAGTAYAVFGGVGVAGSSVYSDNFTFSTVPEPASWAMLIAGFGLVGAASRRQRALKAAHA